MLHAAVWSGGTFIYVPKGVKVNVPLQAYFRMNAERGGQFEHTLIIADEGSELEYIEGCSAPKWNASALHAGCVEIIVKKGARVKYSSIENWSKNTYNLNTKRALVDERGTIEWLNGNMGSGTTMLYPMSVLRGEGARSESLGVAFAGAGQHQDTGSKVVHAAPNTSSVIRAKSISAGGGVSTYRGSVRVTKAAKGGASRVQCDALILDDRSVSNTYPTMRIDTDDALVAHEATVGKIGEDELFYCASRGLDEAHAVQLIVGGFIEPVVKRLPLEYAVELNKLIELETANAVG
jgi:Fe-S cluster assembly protein SufB